MIIKGSARKQGAKPLADHLMNATDNERVKVLEIAGTMAKNLFEAFRDFEAVASGSRSQRPYYHVSISPDRPLTRQQLERAISLMEETFGFSGQPRAVVEHVKGGREHYHVVWQRYDLTHDRMIEYGHNYRRHEQVARQLEKEFGHEPVLGAHVREKAEVKRPDRTPDHAEQQQAKRLGVHPLEVRAEMSAIFGIAKNGQEFVAMIATEGYQLAQGRRNSFAIVDEKGGVHSLARRLDGETLKSIREKFSDVDRNALPTVAEAQAKAAEAEKERAKEKEKEKEKERGKAKGGDRATGVGPVAPASEIQLPRKLGARSQSIKRIVTDLYAHSDSASQMLGKLAEAGYYLARGDRRDFVIVDDRGGVHSLARRIDGMTASKLRAFLSHVDANALPSAVDVREAILTSRALERDVKDVASATKQMASGVRASLKQVEAKAGTTEGLAGAVAAPVEKVITAVADMVTELFSPSQPPTKEQIKAKISASAAAEKVRQPWEMTPAEQNKWLREQEAKQRNELIERGIDPRKLDDRGERPISRPPDRGRE